jgi:putative SOS response-associated peptidase YedK
MCGRITLRATPEDLGSHFGVSKVDCLPRFNIAPTQDVATVRDSGQGRELVFLQWGLIPSWAKDKKIGAKLINARAETVAEKPAFRSAFKHRRCLIPADGFFEWKKEGAKKQPHYITLQDGGLYALAGLWQECRSEGGEAIRSCTIITTRANDLIQPLHDRMPVILDPGDYAEWLDRMPRPKEELMSLLRPFPSDKMRSYPVSSMVNSARNQGPGCIEQEE